MPPGNASARSLSATGILQALAALLLLASCIGFLGAGWWPFDLASHFRIQYFAALVLTGGTSLLFKRRRLAFASLAGALLNAAVILPLWIPPAAPLPTQGQRLRAMTFNIHTANADKAGAIEVVRASDADVVALLEVDQAWMIAIRNLRDGYPFAVEEPREDNFGICLLSRWPIKDATIHHWGQSEVPSIEARLETNGVSVTVIATHPLPPAGRERALMRDEQLDLLAAHLPTINGLVVVMGDLNTTPWGASFRDLLARSGLRDSARGFGWQPTWPANLPPLFIPLDHVLVSPEIGVSARSAGSAAGSDHRSVVADLVVPLPDSSRGDPSPSSQNAADR